MVNKDIDRDNIPIRKNNTIFDKPIYPRLGQMYYNKDREELKRWTGKKWELIKKENSNDHTG